jgi:hypothetical protein
MKITTLFALAALWPLATQGQGSAPALDNSEVRITYGELKRLLAAAAPPTVAEPRKPLPPVAAALVSARYQVNSETGDVTVEMEVENFDGGWHAIAVAGAGQGASAVEPAEARMVVKEGMLCVVTDKAGTMRVKLTFPAMLSGEAFALKLAPSAVHWLEAAQLPVGNKLRLTSEGTSRALSVGGLVALPAAGGEVLLTLEDEDASPARTAAVADAGIISQGAYTTEVVRDGTVLTEGTLVVRHDLPTQLKVTLPKGAALLQCLVNSEPLRLPVAEDRLEIPLEEASTDGAESEVKISYTQQLGPLESAEGEVTLALPQMAEFARVIDWAIRMPDGFDLTVTGNVEPMAPDTAAPAAKSAELKLRKSLCRGQQPQARITYRRR